MDGGLDKKLQVLTDGGDSQYVITARGPAVVPALDSGRRGLPLC